jgi:hypothetical protein
MAQPYEGSTHVALHRSEREAEVLGDRALAEPVVEGELEDFALPLAEGRQRVSEQ